MELKYRWLRHQRKGFTLVEVVVTITLLALVFVMTAPFTRAWVNAAKVSETESVLQQAIGMARSHAMHSQSSQGAVQAPVAVVCILAQDLEVRLVNTDIDLSAGQKPCVHSRVVWRTRITEQVTPAYIGENDKPMLLSELYFDNRGQLASQYCNNAVTPGTCATSDLLEVSAEGAEKVQFSAR